MNTLGRVRGQAWSLAGIGFALWALLYIAFGPLSQSSAYHLFADTRTCLGIPRAGDVLSNLSILAAGLWGGSLHARVRVAAEERAAYRMLVAGALLTAAGSAYYHWAPDNTRLFWDRLPMTLVLVSALALVLADRVDRRFGREALIPFLLLCAGGAIWWAVSERLGAGDTRLYLVGRLGAGVVIAVLLVLRRGRHDAARWLWAALALEVAMTVAEKLDYEIFTFTGGFASGHNLKHLLAGALLACLFAWLARRKSGTDHDLLQPAATSR